MDWRKSSFSGDGGNCVEVRQDLIADERGQEKWAGILHRVLNDVLANPALHEIRMAAP